MTRGGRMTVEDARVASVPQPRRKAHPLTRMARRALRRVQDFGRNAIDRSLHGYRGRRARSCLEQIDPSRVLFVCLGNICRSPYAEHTWNSLAPRRVTAGSAGFIGPDRPPPDEALEAATERWDAHADHRSRLLTPQMVRSADAIFVFDGSQVRQLRSRHPGSVARILWLGDFDPVWDGARAIDDPWGKDLPEFRRTFGRIERCVVAAAEVLGSSPRNGSG